MPVWTQIESIEVEHAERMLREHGELAPSLYAFRFDELTFMADLRPFERFGMAGALDEVLPLVSATRSNRVVLGTTGRAWSLDDPVPPVTEGADLRQRVHVTMFLDATTRPPRGWTAVRPFELCDGDLRWGEPFDPGEASGPV